MGGRTDSQQLVQYTRDNQVSSPEPQNSLLQIVSNAGSSEQSELSVDTSTTWSFNDLENFDLAQYYGSTDMSTTPSMTTPSIEDGTAHNPIVLTDEAPITPISVRPTEPPAIVERVWQWSSKLARSRCENSFWISLILYILYLNSLWCIYTFVLIHFFLSWTFSLLQTLCKLCWKKAQQFFLSKF